MKEQYIVEIVIIIITCIIANILIDRIKSWWRNRRRSGRHSSQNEAFPVNSNNSSNTPPLPVRNASSSNTTNETRGHSGPPSLPQVRNNFHSNIYDFPKCPIHKCCNRRNHDQKIFWNTSRRMWECYAGHFFNS